MMPLILLKRGNASNYCFPINNSHIRMLTPTTIVNIACHPENEKKKVNYFISYDCMKSKDKVETPTSIKLYSLRAQCNFTPPDVFCHCLLYLFIIISLCKVYRVCSILN